MNCKDSMKLIPDFLSGEIDSRTMKELLKHSAECDHCSSLLADLRKTVKVIGEIPAPELGENERIRLENNVLTSIHAAQHKKKHTFFRGFASFDFLPEFSARNLVFAGMPIVCILAVIFLFSAPGISPELTPEVALKICEDPDVWEPYAWNTIEKTGTIGFENLESEEGTIGFENLESEEGLIGFENLESEEGLIGFENLESDGTDEESMLGEMPAETSEQHLDSVSETFETGTTENDDQEILDSEDSSIWYLIEELDVQGKDRLIQELKEEFRV